MNRIPHLQPLEHGLVVASCHGKVKEDAHRLRANTIGGKVKGVVQFFQGLEAELNGLAMFFFLPKLGETGCEDQRASFPHCLQLCALPGQSQC